MGDGYWPSVADGYRLEMAHFCWRRFPVIVFTVQISDGRIHEFFRCHIVQASEIDGIELAPTRRVPNTERANPAVLAK